MSLNAAKPTFDGQPTAYRRRRRGRIDRLGFFGAFLRNGRSLTGLVIFVVFLLVALLAPLIAPDNPTATIFPMSLPPGGAHLLGTTNTGQDIFSQFLFGARTTMTVGFGAGILATLLGLLIGIAAGYRGGWVDSILTFLMNLFLVLPGLALLIVIES